MAAANDDPHLGAGPSEDSEILLDSSDSGSILSDDSVLPEYETDSKYKDPAKTLYEACTRNESTSLSRILERGVTRDEVMELDINGKVRCMTMLLTVSKVQATKLLFSHQSGLMVAVGKGFVDIVTMLHTCPYVDINHQDNDGNTALMIAAQAGMSEQTLHTTLFCMI